MSMNHLLRTLAPISHDGWQLLDKEAKERLTVTLGARKVVDFSGPHGWSYSSTNLGRTEAVADVPVVGISACRREVLRLTEVRAEFIVSRRDLLDYDRGAADPDLRDLDRAVMRMASTENIAVFHGWESAGITGITESSPNAAIERVEDFNDYPRRVALAVTALLRNGISGPYGLALGPNDYTAVIETSEHGGYPLLDHLRQILGGPIVWAAGVRGAVVLSLRGGDFLFESGQDLSLGYDYHDGEAIHLYLEQSFSFRVATPEAAVEMVGE